MTNESLDIVGSIKGLSDWVQTQQMLYKQLIARKVKIRAIVQETNNPEANQTNLQKHKLLNHLNIGFSPSPLCTYLGIYDNKDVKRAKSHFEKLWNESTITKNQQLMQ